MRTSSAKLLPLLGLSVMLTLLPAGCGSVRPERFSADLTASMKEVEAGKSIRVSVKLKNPPEGLRYHWSASAGQCDPENDVETTTYNAPAVITEDKAPVKITLDILQAGKEPYILEYYITVKRGRASSPPINNIAPESTPVPSETSGDTRPSTPLSSSGSSDAQPVIRVTQIPPEAPGGPRDLYPIEGDVSGADPGQYQIVLYSYSNQWWIQPFDYDWGTRISRDGKWSNVVHGGSRYAVLLVNNSFNNPPFTTYSLPTISSDVVAITIVPGKRR